MEIDEDKKELLAGKFGINTSELEELLRQKPELAEAMSRSFGASLMPEVNVPRGQSVGPYGAYVASSPFSRLAQGGMQGAKVGMQMGGQRAILDALRGGGGMTPDDAKFGAPSGDIDAFGAGPSMPPMQDNDAGYTMPTGYGGEDEMPLPLQGDVPKPNQPSASMPAPQGPPPGPPPGAPQGPPQVPPMPGEIPSASSIPQQAGAPPPGMPQMGGPGQPRPYPGETPQQYQRRVAALNSGMDVAP